MIWLDLDNTPHVQYILPVALAFKNMGYELCITARDYGQILDLLRMKGAQAKVIGRGFSKNKALKVLQTMWRAGALARYVREHNPILCLSNSRAAALTSKFLAIKNFTFCDFENSELRSYEKLGCYMVYPDVIPCDVFRNLGFKDDNLVPYPGLKENITLDGFSVPEFCPLPFLNLQKTIVVLRPPSTRTHYHIASTGELFDELERYLTSNLSNCNLQLVVLPRDPEQKRLYISKYSGCRDVFVADRVIDGPSLIWFSDLVFSGGGTMAREAALLGSKSYTVFLSRTGAVDKYLEALGKMVLIKSNQDFARIAFDKVHRGRFDPDEYREFSARVARLIQEKATAR